jgi:hypothetical protein
MEKPVDNQTKWIAFLNFLKTVNLFESESNDVEKIHRERISTRLYLVLLSLFIVSLIIYGAILSRTITVTIPRPTEYQFNEGVSTQLLPDLHQHISGRI